VQFTELIKNNSGFFVFCCRFSVVGYFERRF